MHVMMMMVVSGLIVLIPLPSGSHVSARIWLGAVLLWWQRGGGSRGAGQGDRSGAGRGAGQRCVQSPSAVDRPHPLLRQPSQLHGQVHRGRYSTTPVASQQPISRSYITRAFWNIFFNIKDMYCRQTRSGNVMSFAEDRTANLILHFEENRVTLGFPGKKSPSNNYSVYHKPK